MAPVDQLARLLAFHENAAAAIRLTLSLLPTSRTNGTRATNGHARGPLPPGIMRAIAIDTIRRTKTPGETNGHGAHAAAGRKPARGHHTRKIRAQRKRPAAVLARFDPTDPRPAAGGVESRGIGAFVYRGYLKPKGNGYIRTAKPYAVDPREQ